MQICSIMVLKSCICSPLFAQKFLHTRRLKNISVTQVNILYRSKQCCQRRVSYFRALSTVAFVWLYLQNSVAKLSAHTHTHKCTHQWKLTSVVNGVGQPQHNEGSGRHIHSHTVAQKRKCIHTYTHSCRHSTYIQCPAKGRLHTGTETGDCPGYVYPHLQLQLCMYRLPYTTGTFVRSLNFRLVEWVRTHRDFVVWGSWFIYLFIIIILYNIVVYTYTLIQLDIVMLEGERGVCVGERGNYMHTKIYQGWYLIWYNNLMI